MKQSFLVIDSGGSKSDWCIVKDGQRQYGTTDSLHPNFSTREQIIRTLEKIPKVFETMFDAVFFYSAGLRSHKKRDELLQTFSKLFDAKKIEVNEDLLGAARATAGNSSGIIVILGTGSIGAYYNGEDIEEKYGGWGYILGDEGSGAYMGKLLVQKWLGGDLSENIDSHLTKYIGVQKSDFLSYLYTHSKPNKLLASLTPFIAKHIDQKAVGEVVTKNFADLNNKLISPLASRYLNSNIYLLGSIAHHFETSISKAMDSICSLSVLEKPIKPLSNYHNG